MGAAVFADDVSAGVDSDDDVVDEAVDELAWPAAAGAAALEPAPAVLPVDGDPMFVCSNDEKLCDGVLADAELAGGAELGPDINSRIAGVMKRAART